MSIYFPKGYLMTDPNQYNSQNPQQAPQYGGYGSYGQNDYGQQAPQYDAPDYGQQAPQYGSPQYSAPQYNNAAGYNQQQPQYGAPQPQGTNGFFALTAPLISRHITAPSARRSSVSGRNTPHSGVAPPAANSGGGFCATASSSRFWTPSSMATLPMAFKELSTPFGDWQRFIPSLALSVRRLHDINKPGTTLVILYVANLIGATVIGVFLMGIRFTPAMDGSWQIRSCRTFTVPFWPRHLPGHVDHIHRAHGQEDRSGRRTLRRPCSRQRLCPSSGGTDPNPCSHKRSVRHPVWFRRFRRIRRPYRGRQYPSLTNVAHNPITTTSQQNITCNNQ